MNVQPTKDFCCQSAFIVMTDRVSDFSDTFSPSVKCLLSRSSSMSRKWLRKRLFFVVLRILILGWGVHAAKYAYVPCGICEAFFCPKGAAPPTIERWHGGQAVCVVPTKLFWGDSRFPPQLCLLYTPRLLLIFLRGPIGKKDRRQCLL